MSTPTHPIASWLNNLSLYAKDATAENKERLSNLATLLPAGAEEIPEVKAILSSVKKWKETDQFDNKLHEKIQAAAKMLRLTCSPFTVRLPPSRVCLSPTTEGKQ